MQQQQDIKETLEYLSGILRSFGIRGVKAETIRKAKFNDDSTVNFIFLTQIFFQNILKS